MHMSVELFELGKESRVREMAVHDANAIVDVIGRMQRAASFFHRLQVAWRDIAGSADQSIIGHVRVFLLRAHNTFVTAELTACVDENRGMLADHVIVKISMVGEQDCSIIAL